MDFEAYTHAYYARRLKDFEALNPSILSESERLRFAGEASALKKFLFDNKEEGYEKTFNGFVQELNAVERLEHVLHRLLGEESEATLFYLYPQKVAPKFAKETTTAVRYELQEYVERLASLTMADLDLSFTLDGAHRIWLEKTERVIAEMTSYIRWILERRSPGQDGYIFALRDALLPYLGFRELQKQGLVCEAVPIMVGRKLLDQYGYCYYDQIIPAIYDLLETNGGRMPLTAFVPAYRQRIRRLSTADFDRARADLRCYLDSLLHEKRYTVIESGIQGTIPLFLGSLDERVADFLMYTAAPWLYELYRPIIFRDNYNYLREMETLVCQDDLFEFDRYKDGKVYIREYQDPLLKSMAYYEILLLKQQLASSQSV